jgi:TfoX/Sxy family transcriptional regulator of competence genes
MAFDPGLAQTLRDALADLPVTERKMFGGLAFLLHGHMVCGVHKGGAMVRVGKDGYHAALSLPGVSPMMFTGKPMIAMVDVADASVEDDGIRGQLLGLALATVQALPPKVAKPKKG